MLHNSFNEILQISALFIYKDANWQGTRTFFQIFGRETSGPVQMLTDVSASFHLLAKCHSYDSKFSSCMWS